MRMMVVGDDPLMRASGMGYAAIGQPKVLSRT